MLPPNILPDRSDSAGRPRSVAPIAARQGLAIGLGWHCGKAPELTAGLAAPSRRGGASSTRSGWHGTRYDRTISPGDVAAGLLLAAILFTVLTEWPVLWLAAWMVAQ